MRTTWNRAAETRMPRERADTAKEATASISSALDWMRLRAQKWI